MIIGVPKEIKVKETRVALTPEGARLLVEKGHKVFVETHAGKLSGFSNARYESAGASICETAAEVWKNAELIVKVKEPLEQEYQYFRDNLNLFTFLHLASVPPLADALCKYGVTSIGYETVECKDNSLPLLIPMSEVAGRVGAQVGTTLLHRVHGGKGLLLGGVTGTKKGCVVVLGGGHAGLNAAEVAAGIGAQTVVLDVKEEKLKYIEEKYKGKILAIKSSAEAIAEWTAKADLLIGAVLVTGDKAPHLLCRSHLKAMEEGSVIVDIAIDQGGCVETSRPTSHEEPTFVEEGIIHYCVTNMPALTPRTSTEALTKATFPYVLELANRGISEALEQNEALGKGLQTKAGKVTLPVLEKLFPHLAL
ncbi:MAG: alanine dehydrogenase [Deltaproteobacteria bacterium CG_4_10_14_0_2_um_filter_43_8]|nr:MAG: alanine dehydrogenase [Deltaproteobacteria bacterium CG11_big_fil_rev_8_21_14_0_20_42_23]PJA21825.1 MAG: alanine dehydrogenase [Deltaproteobacteria bacterium CG_4_10_14_0_2_um_filter_43_8]PJC63699.1 MAG: alanine dehydrogenase [Deltaproteobacteria bacterium CG_4_9_14_0_2_um_filter_42_21]